MRIMVVNTKHNHHYSHDTSSYIVMCAILRVVAYFLSVNLLHMYTVFVVLCVAHFPLKE